MENNTGKEPAWTIEDYYSLGFILLLTVVFNTLFIDKYFPVTEGWFQFYSMSILNGEIPYKDFYLFIPPVFPYMMSALCAVFGNAIIVLRIFGLVERLLLITLAYCLVRRVFTSPIAFISVLTSSFVFASSIQDVYYGYYQTSLLFAFLMIITAIKLYEHAEGPGCFGYAILFGIVSGLTTMLKHTTGVILFALLLVILAIALHRRFPRALTRVVMIAVISDLSIVAAIVGLFAVTNALGPMLDQLFLGGSSKGSLADILFGFLTRIFTNESIELALSIALTIAINYCYFRINQSTKVPVSLIKVVWLLCSIALFVSGYFVLWRMTRQSGVTSPAFLSSKLNIALCVVAGIAILFIAYAGQNFTDISARKKVNMRIFSGLFLSVFLLGLFLVCSDGKHVSLNWGNVREYRQHLHFSVFLVDFFLCVYFVLSFLKKDDERTVKVLFLVGGGWGLMYIHGMSYTIEDHAMFLPLAMAIGLLLSSKTVLNCLKNIMIYATCLLLIASVYIQKRDFPYHWWGVNTLPAVYRATDSFKDPLLRGMHGSPEQVRAMNEIFDVISSRKKANDTMFAFPHIQYFNVMAGLKSTTKAKVHYFDVCDDKTASQDAGEILHDPPTFLLWMNMDGEVWDLHEEIFRGGRRSGQRDIRDAYTELTRSGKYELLWMGKIGNSDPLYVWHLSE